VRLAFARRQKDSPFKVGARRPPAASLERSAASFIEDRGTGGEARHRFSNVENVSAKTSNPEDLLGG
jgi:hypothetical protein